MSSPRREFKFTEKGIPTLAEQWRGEIPEILNFPPTESGRRARGQLGNLLDHICKSWLMGGVSKGYPEMCTAEWLAKAVTELDGKPVSTGAIARVLHKWKEVDYAVVEEGPLRFVGLSAQGMKLGFDEIERRKKKKSKHFDWDAAALRKGKSEKGSRRTGKS